MFQKIKKMKFKSKLKIPQKSIFGFKVLSSFHSSIFSYFLLISGKILNPLFGFSSTQLIAGCLFNIILNITILILTINLILKRKQIKKNHFIILNLIIFFYLPFSIYTITKQIKFLISLWS